MERSPVTCIAYTDLREVCGLLFERSRAIAASCMGLGAKIRAIKRAMPASALRIVLSLFLVAGALHSQAQTKPEDGGHEIELWSGGGHSVPGGRSDTSVWNAGGRFGWILTAPHGPGFLKGRFEYAVDATPVFVVFQPANTAYGAGFSPLVLKWLLATRGNAVPYFELNGGTLFSNHDIPTGTNNVNFTDAAAVGVHFLRDTYNWSVEARYMHVSNAGLAPLNSGVNTVQVRIGIGKFFHCKR